MKITQLIGSRLIKTAVAIFITAWVCELVGWPPVFAVITAIVTLEPTVSESIKKGFIRFPASAIGSAYAVLFIALFGNSPITYTLAAFFTIATCVTFRLHAGLLVATLTAVAMVEVIHNNFLISFFIRLGTTTIGLIVSTAVNMFILPPDYTKDIVTHIRRLNKQTGKNIEKLFQLILNENEVRDADIVTPLHTASTKVGRLIQFQEDESKYHPLVGHEKHIFQHAQQQMITIRMIHYHMDNLLHTSLENVSWSQDERSVILQSVEELAEGMKSKKYFDQEKHKKQLKQLTNMFWEDSEEITKSKEQHPTHFPPKLIILYELLSIFELVTRFYQNESEIEKSV
ncbi:aromatic acid exporter family protein [Ornithinibacillus sp. L9]|uniref:Aromatic acid exporter family protein n=1 Tax=Ornithinibacillus caprae TaxID=2678566 RepID=A0A6N8FJY4_9BACI|nr:aromatic acid exporter family protein [Ornithinibacillus caprae]MUK89962.1 aromatic acid exporter family protein [Ornithinibacillus caprae]